MKKNLSSDWVIIITVWPWEAWVPHASYTCAYMMYMTFYYHHQYNVHYCVHFKVQCIMWEDIYYSKMHILKENILFIDWKYCVKHILTQLQIKFQTNSSYKFIEYHIHITNLIMLQLKLTRAFHFKSDNQADMDFSKWGLVNIKISS